MYRHIRGVRGNQNHNNSEQTTAAEEAPYQRYFRSMSAASLRPAVRSNYYCVQKVNTERNRV